MRKNLRIFATAIAFVCVAASAQTSWVETPYANLTTGDIVVIADTASKTAIINTNGSGKAPVAEAITLGENNSTITSSVDASLQWVVTVEDGTYKFNVEGTNNYLYSTNSNNGLRVGKSENNVFTIFASGDSVYLVNSATNRYVGVYFNGDEIYGVDLVYICKEYEGELKPQKEEVNRLFFMDLDNMPEKMSIRNKQIIVDLKNYLK